MPTQKEIWDAYKAPDTLKECVQLFFELMDKKEYSSNDVEFHPNKFDLEGRCISSCRVWDTHRLGRVLGRMKELCNEPS